MDGDDLDDHGWSELSYEVDLIVEDYFARADADSVKKGGRIELRLVGSTCGFDSPQLCTAGTEKPAKTPPT